MREKVKKQYQPDYPLKYDEVYGPYRPITTLEGSIHRNFVNLLLTNPGEWPMNPDLGIGLKRYLFENYNSPELPKLKPRMQRQIDKYLPNVQLLSVDFKSTDEEKDESFVTVGIKYAILGETLVSIIASMGYPHGISIMEKMRKLTGLPSLDASTGLISNMRVL